MCHRSQAGNILGRFDRRGYEIQSWLDSNPDYTAIVILDDDRDMAHLLPWLVHVHNGMDFGVMEEHVAKACLLFGEI